MRETHWGTGGRYDRPLCGRRGLTTKDQRRLTCPDCCERVDQSQRLGVHARPNEPLDTTKHRCPASKYGEHRFVCDGGRICEFCHIDFHDIPKERR